MKKILTIAAPAKAILCGEHAVVYGEDAIAFGVDLKCYAQVYQSPANKN
jgi:mevalonate kinase